jgi:hypothetical protein
MAVLWLISHVRSEVIPTQLKVVSGFDGTGQWLCHPGHRISHHCRLRLKCDGTRAETRFRLSAKRTIPLKSAGASVQSTTGSRGVRISGTNVGCTMFRGSVRVLATHSIRQFPLHFPSRAFPCTITFQLDSTCSYEAT